MATKRAKMNDLINYRIRVTTLDSRQLTGQMLAFDQHMNLVLADCEEFRLTKKALSGKSASSSGSEEKRTLGLVILRGETVISLSIESPPPSDGSTKLGTIPPGPGTAQPLNRGFESFGGLPTRPGAPLAGPIPGDVGAGFVPPAFFGAPQMNSSNIRR